MSTPMKRSKWSITMATTSSTFEMLLSTIALTLPRVTISLSSSPTKTLTLVHLHSSSIFLNGIIAHRVRLIWIAGTLIKKFAHNSFAGAFYGLAFTKENNDFLGTIQKKYKKDDKILMVCQEGLRLALLLTVLLTCGPSRDDLDCHSRMPFFMWLL